MGIKVLSAARALPKRKVDNHFFASYLDTSDEWIQSRTGIKTRFFADEETVLTLALEAAEKALQKAHIPLEEVAMVLVATFSSENRMPTTAAMVAKALQIPEDVLVADINVACTGFVTALSLAEGYLKQGRKPYALIIGAEVLTNIVDLEDRNTAVLFGDGAGALVIGSSEKAFYSIFGSRGNDQALFCGKSSQDKIQMQGPAVFKFATSIAGKTLNHLAQEANISPSEIKHIYLHQANQRIINLIKEKYNLQKNHIPCNLQDCGNTSAASLPILFAESLATEKPKVGEYCALVGFGGGLTWGGILFEWS